MNIYDFTVKDQAGNDVALESYKGKPLLIVNTATECGFTPQYTDLQEIYDDMGGSIEILDFPCNQFGSQAPGSDDEIHTFCTGRFGVTFPQFSKIEVNGEGAAPLFKYLTENTSFNGFGDSEQGKRMTGLLNPDDSSDIKWNFTKFLIDKDGNIVERFEPTVPMEEVKEKIKEVVED